jgi:adenylate kinase family enzyme
VPLTTEPAGARRILVYGVTGSGKSTAAKRIARRTGLPLTLADELTWQPGWVPVDEGRQRELFTAVVARDRWVLDTAYAAWLDIVLPRVDLIVALDYPRWFSLQRLVRRTVMRSIDKRPICNGNTQSLRGLYAPDSIVRWHFRTFAEKRRMMRHWAEGSDGPPVVMVRKAKDLDDWISRISGSPTRLPGIQER